MTTKEKYEKLVRRLRAEGLKIYHKKQGKDTGGSYDASTKIIEIDPVFRNSKKGIFVLLHEYQHYLQHKNKKFKWFFRNRGLSKVTPEKMAEVFAAEKNASELALIEYNKLDLGDYIPEELDDSNKEWLYNFYLDSYFKKSK
jgi:hypothetical protein